MSDDKLDRIASKHQAADISREMRKATEPPPERITKPSNAAVVSRIVKRESAPADR